MSSNQLPADVQERIKAEAATATDKEAERLKMRNQEYGRMVSQLHGYEAGYITGATAEAKTQEEIFQWFFDCKRILINCDSVEEIKLHWQQWEEGKEVGNG